MILSIMYICAQRHEERYAVPPNAGFDLARSNAPDMAADLTVNTEPLPKDIALTSSNGSLQPPFFEQLQHDLVTAVGLGGVEALVGGDEEGVV